MIVWTGCSDTMATAGAACSTGVSSALTAWTANEQTTTKAIEIYGNNKRKNKWNIRVLRE